MLISFKVIKLFKTFQHLEAFKILNELRFGDEARPGTGRTTLVSIR